jgi:hypothetical protein
LSELERLRSSARGESKFPHGGYLKTTLINSIISRKSQKLLSGLLVRADLNVLQLSRHDPGTFTEAVHRIARGIELAGERGDHITILVEFAFYRAEKLPDLARCRASARKPIWNDVSSAAKFVGPAIMTR